MNEVSLFDLLREGKIDSCHQFVDQASSGGEDLVKYLNTLLYYSVSIKWVNSIKNHPLIIVNSIKNIIADNRANPSKKLLFYCLRILTEKPIRDNDDEYINDIIKDGVGSTVFVGSLEDAIQSGDWEKAKILAAKIFLASDHSRAVIDSIADLGLQDIDNNGLFIFHLLRAFHFKQEKPHAWTYACCLIDMLQSKPLPEPHIRQGLEPNKLFDLVLSYCDAELLVTYASILRIWGGDYVRQDSYNREISHWLYSKQSSKKKIIDKEESEIVLEQSINHKNFIQIAENIISKENPISQSSKNIVILEALRHIAKIKSNKILYYYVNELITS
ncbi:MAG: hypothetical protein VX279_01375 [Candidatus Neomarinimicrobiota bacterium]|nr:hypothetical protein [Candidatus Neomarinimicrobiota bacterium]